MKITKSISIRTHIGQDDQHVLLALVGQVLSSGKGQTRGNNTFDGGIVSQVQEQGHTLHGTVLLEILLEETSSLHVHTHSSEHNSEVGVLKALLSTLVTEVDQTSLSANLSSQLHKCVSTCKNTGTMREGHTTSRRNTYIVVRKTSSREDRNLLTTSNRAHGINGRNTSLDHFFGVDTSTRVDGLTLDVKELLSQNGGSTINGLSGSVEHTAQNILGHGNTENVSCEFATSVTRVDTRGTFEHLYKPNK